MSPALLAKPPIVVSQEGSGPFVGKDHRPIQAAINHAGKDGGEIIIDSGEYLINESLKILSTTNLTIRGKSGAVLRLAGLPYAQAIEATPTGATSIRVDQAQRIAPGMRLHIMAPGKVHAFTGKPEPYFLATAARATDNRIEVSEPLAFPIPNKTHLYREGAPNIFVVRGACENVVIEGLTLDGGRRSEDPAISGHVIGCGVLAEGPFKYEKGVTGTPVRKLVVRDCVIRHCFGRGVAMYAVTDGAVERCTIEDTVDEAIDLDHFAVGCRAEGNTVTKCHIGMELNDANESIVRSNRFDSCDIGINLWRWCHQPDLNARNQILNNEFLNTKNSVLLIQSKTSSNIICGNTIQGAGGVGIVLNGSSQLLATNTISGAGAEGILVTADDSLIRDNQCYDNSRRKPGQSDGIRIVGNKNRAFGNRVGSTNGTLAHRRDISDEGKENEVRKP